MAVIPLRPDAMRWVFTGDSVTHGAAHTHGERDYVQLFEERLRWELGRRRDHVIRTAVSGRTVADLAADLDWSVLQYRPDVVSLMFGLNDCRAVGASPAAFAARFGEVLDAVEATGATVILHTPNRVRPAASDEFPALAEFAEVVRELARDHGCVLVDHFRAWSLPTAHGALDAWLADACHPNGYGHRAIARLLLTRLGMAGADSPTLALDVPHLGELDGDEA